MSPKVAVFPLDQSFLDNYRPVMLWFRLIGVDLNVQETRSATGRFVYFVYTFCLICLNMICSIVNLFIAFPRNEVKHDRIFEWNMFVRQIYFAFRSIAVHLLLICLVKNSWKQVWLALQQFESLIRVQVDCHRNIHKICILGILYIVVKVCSLIALIIGGYLSHSKISYLTIAEEILSYSTDIYPLSALLLFGVLGWSISKSFRTIRKEMNETARKASKLSHIEVAELLIKWRRSYMIVCKSAKKLNRCFGWILLIEIPYIFVEFIYTSFFIMYSTTGKNHIAKNISWILMSASIKIFCLIQLFIISYVADVISKEGSKLMKALCHLQVSIPQLSNQLHQLMVQVHCSIPQVEVLGLFSVGRKLIPTLLASTFTYLIILFQFHQEEQD